MALQFFGETADLSVLRLALADCASPSRALCFVARGLSPQDVPADPSSLIVLLDAGSVKIAQAQHAAWCDAGFEVVDLALTEGIATPLLAVTWNDAKAKDYLHPLLQAAGMTLVTCSAKPGHAARLAQLSAGLADACMLATLENVSMGRKLGVPLATLTNLLNRGTGRNAATRKVLPALEAQDLAALRSTDQVNSSLDVVTEIASAGQMPALMFGAAAAVARSAVNFGQVRQPESHSAVRYFEDASAVSLV